MKKFAYKNQQLIEEKQAQVSIHERGFLFGDGIFETCKIFNGKIYNFKAHEARIQSGLKALKFCAEISDLEKKSLQLIAKNKIKNGVLRISISRGIGSEGYLPTYKSKPLIIIRAFNSKSVTQKIILGISKIKKPPSNSFPIQHKTMQGLIYTLNKISAQEQKFFDCVMLTQENFISETSSANIFWVKNEEIFTPSNSCDILLGTIRAKLLSNKNLKIKKVKMKISELKKADEIFLTNTSFLALSVNEFAGRKLKNKIGKEILEWLKSDVKSCNG